MAVPLVGSQPNKEVRRALEFLSEQVNGPVSYHCRDGMTQKILKILVASAKIVCGVIALILFKWIPRTSEGILLYVMLLAVVIGLGIGLSSRDDTGYWPKKPEE